MSLTEPARQFRVVTHRTWVADLFRPVGGVQDFGMDIAPGAVANTLWWAPGHWVARAARSGVKLPVLSCGQRWMTTVEASRFTRRAIAVAPASNVGMVFEVLGLRRAHVKLPEVKTDEFPAAVRTVREVLAAVEDGTLRGSQLLQVSEPVRFGDEARFFLANGEVTAWSHYRVADRWWGEDGFDATAARTKDTDMLLAMARRVAQAYATPPGFVADIGILRGCGQPQTELIEVNASWSSNPYDAEPEGVFASIRAAHDFDNEHPERRFDTDQYGTVPPLRLR